MVALSARKILPHIVRAPAQFPILVGNSKTGAILSDCVQVLNPRNVFERVRARTGVGAETKKSSRVDPGEAIIRNIHLPQITLNKEEFTLNKEERTLPLLMLSLILFLLCDT